MNNLFELGLQVFLFELGLQIFLFISKCVSKKMSANSQLLKKTKKYIQKFNAEIRKLNLTFELEITTKRKF